LVIVLNIVRCIWRFSTLRILALVPIALSFLVLAACDPTKPSAPPTRTSVVFWSPPTPFPPFVNATAAATPDTAGEPGDGLLGEGGASLRPEDVGRIQQELLQVEIDAQTVRGLQPKTDVPEHFINREQLRTLLLQQRDKTYTRERSRLDELRLWLLRYVPRPSIGLYQMQANWLSEQLLGYYDSDAKQLYVVDPKLPLDPQTRQTLAHEYVHSLQDQHFGVQGLLAAASTDGDRDLAARSLVEGDAVLSSVLYSDQYMTHDDFGKLQSGFGSTAALDSAPDIVRESLYFPYTRGLDFVKTLYTLGGFPAVNNALSHPPASTEQILHPQKFLSSPRDEPLLVGLPPLTDTLGASWYYKDTQYIGEFELGVLLRTNGVSDADAQTAVAGWGGGQCDLYQNGARSLAMLVTRWDTIDDANQFYSAMLQSLGSAKSTGTIWTDGSRFFALRQKSDRVVFVGGTDRATVERAPLTVR
jgi:hypothetical protein